MRRTMIWVFVLMLLAISSTPAVQAHTELSASAAAVLADLALPAPRMEGGKPLLQALANRQSSRSFKPEALSLQMLSDLLWAAAGINRPDSGKRTAPSARNWQTIDVLVVLPEGIYRYDAKVQALKGLVKGDLRRLAGTQDFVASAPLNLVYVADSTRIKGEAPEEERLLWQGAEAGFISQNVYLFCASEGLATVVRASVDRKTLAEALNLPTTSRIILAQTVGFPAP